MLAAAGCFDRRRALCTVGFQLFELQLKLLDLALDLLRLAPELHASQLGDEQLQMLDLMRAMREQLLVLCDDHRPQRVGIQRVQIRQRCASGNHGRSMP